MTYLAAVLFLPWFAILGALFCLLPREPVHRARRVHDAVSLLLATAAFVLALRWSMAAADLSYGGMWPQVLATSVGYGVFLLVLLAAWALRAWRWPGVHHAAAR